MATVMVLQRFEGLSDGEAVEQAAHVRALLGRAMRMLARLVPPH
jgi:hypothetical protein